MICTLVSLSCWFSDKVKECRAALVAEYAGTQGPGMIPRPELIGLMKLGRPCSYRWRESC